ncbi:MAG: host specificity protein [Chloroflexi bacterium]|nr:host specificity protein [Chloroflexota bacterium]
MAAEIQIRRKLREGKAVAAVSGLHNADMIDYLGQFGLDGVWIECEHGPVSWEQIGDYSRACDLWGMASIVRVNANEPWLITRTLDRGASGIVVPHVSTKAEAERVVVAAKFGPVGLRGMYSGRRSYGVQDYHRRANEETLVVVLVEEMEAIQNLADILTVEHIDVFHVAPQDLAQTMGHAGNPGHPEVQGTIDRALKQIVDAGRVAGTTVTDENRQRYLDAGVQFLTTNWLPWVAKGARELQQTIAARNT